MWKRNRWNIEYQESKRNIFFHNAKIEPTTASNSYRDVSCWSDHISCITTFQCSPEHYITHSSSLPPNWIHCWSPQKWPTTSYHPCKDRFIRLMHLRNRFIQATWTARNIPGLRNVSCRTIRNRLREANLLPHRPAVRPVLTVRHRQARLAWARHHVAWPYHQWRRIVFSDESRFCLQGNDGRGLVYRRQGERFADNCVLQRSMMRGGSVMVWGGISYTARTNLVIINGNLTGIGYRDEIITPHVEPFLNANGPGMILQQDNARPHVGRVVRDHFQQQQINVLPWPAVSPDLSPIEHIWDELERRLRRRQNPPENHHQLAQALQEEWNNMPQQRIQRLIGSMRRRCQAVITAQGGHTRYWDQDFIFSWGCHTDFSFYLSFMTFSLKSKWSLALLFNIQPYCAPTFISFRPINRAQCPT